MTLEPFSTTTDANFKRMIRAARNGDIDLQTDAGWAVGDERTLTLSGIGNRVIILSSFEEYEGCGNVIQADFKTYAQADPGNSVRWSSSESGYGWQSASTMRSYFSDTLIPAMPVYITSIMLEFPVHTTGYYAQGGIVVNGNKLALRTEGEFFGTFSKSIAYTSPQVEMFKTASYRNKGTNGTYGFRDGSSTENNRYPLYQNGSLFTTYASNGCKLYPFFCL